MYRPNRGFNRNTQAMDGGAYISTINTSSLINPDISLSSLYYIMSIANITSMQALTTLTSAQLQTLSDAIDTQIEADNRKIAENTLAIAELNNQINKPGGLQAIYDDANTQYNSKLVIYNYNSTLIAADQIEKAKDLSTLTGLYTISTSYISILANYQKQYDEIVSTLAQNASTVDFYEKKYQSGLLDISTNATLYSTSVYNQSTISTTVSDDLVALNQPGLLPLQLSSISTNYVYDLDTYNQISVQTVNYLISDSILKADLMNSFYSISTLLAISSFSMINANSYKSTMDYYESMESMNDSSIKQYTSEIEDITKQISDINAQNTLMMSALQAEIQTTLSAGANFYAYLQQGLDSECNEYLYGIQEYNAQIGFITASLGVAINANAVAIDNIIFTLIDPTISAASRTANNLQKTTLSNDNLAMNSIINTINSLDAQFSLIISYITAEKIQKETFIQNRYSIFTNFETVALNYSQSQLDAMQSSYYEAFTNLNQTVTSINANILNRTTVLGQINAIVDLQRPLINQYFAQYLFTTDDQLPNNLTRVLDDSGNALGGNIMPQESYNTASNSVYALIPPISF